MWLLSLLLTLPQASAEEETLWDRIREAAEEEVESPGNGKPPPASGEGKPPLSEPQPPQPETTPANPETVPESVVEPDGDPEVVTDPDEDVVEGPPTTAELLLKVDRRRFDIPVVYTPEVIAQVEWFMGPGRGTMRHWLARSTIYKDLIQGELVTARMPTDLLYLAMIESGFSLHARSHADAVGPWQFIESTGLSFDLRIDELVDERRDPVRSTRAAIAYLRKLKNDFGNWYMACAAYNAGEGAVFSAIRSYGTIDYWALIRLGALPEETSAYVPRMLAAVIIAKNPELFGFNDIPYMAARPVDGVEVEAGLEVAHLAKSAGMTMEDFLLYNPHLLGEVLPSEPEIQEIWLPPGSHREFFAALNNRPVGRSSEGRRISVEPEPELDLSHHIKTETTTANPVPSPTAWVSHRISSGESLASVAKRYKCTVEDIRGWNALAEDDPPATGHVLWLKSAP